MLAATTGMDGKRSSKVIDNPWFVLAVLFCVTGVLGVPLLFWTRAFSVPVKLLLAVAVTIYTAVLIALVWLVLVWTYTRLEEAGVFELAWS